MNQITLDLQSVDPSYRLIPLTKGQFAKVDSEDFEYLSQFKWQAQWDRSSKTFRARRRILGTNKTIYMHRDIMQAKSGELIDHRHHDTLDNRRSELRRATKRQNNCNARMRSDNASGYKGVFWHTRDSGWVASIGVNGKQKHLGTFSTAEEARDAYNSAALEYHGDFALPN